MEDLPSINLDPKDKVATTGKMILNIEAGTNTFYPEEPDELERQDIENLSSDEIGKED